MYKTTIKGDCEGYYGINDIDAEDMYCLGRGVLKSVEDIDIYSSFHEYIDHISLAGVFTDSKEYFTYDSINHKIYIIVEYFSENRPTDEQITLIKEYTQGQFSDGIGEGFEQRPIKLIDSVEYEEYECYISMWYRGQELSCEIVKM
jgi:hypothetical protein